MPLSRIFMLKGSRTADQKAVILDQIYLAMRETFDVPEDDRFMMITEHEKQDFLFGHDYMDISRSDELLIIQLTVSDTRTLRKKQDLFARIAARLEQEAGVRPEDVFINLVETKLENWSFGNGVAQYTEANDQWKPRKTAWL
jgi:4-oxalocrotonate tautomerase